MPFQTTTKLVFPTTKPKTTKPKPKPVIVFYDSDGDVIMQDVWGK